ncbi:MAG: orotidine-5'-phosphate decarboxylase [Deltaproteobacteria bacterium]|nr:MAG: orotidine-5'-phosphate decarboxylase [Deltaproteobacteria bacterium]
MAGSGHDRIVFPLDVPTREAAEQLVELLDGHVGMFKVGLELFIEAGPDMVRWIRKRTDANIFLDLKLHDIPATVGKAVSRAAGLGADFITVHCGEQTAMLAAAVSHAQGRIGILGVTVLTSIHERDLSVAGFASPYADDVNALVTKRARQAMAAGCSGVICSGHEAPGIKREAPAGFLAMTPGIRPAWEGVGTDDQARVLTPAEAVANGADYLVIGRPIRNADDPVAAADRVAAEIASGSA